MRQVHIKRQLFLQLYGCTVFLKALLSSICQYNHLCLHIPLPASPRVFHVYVLGFGAVLSVTLVSADDSVWRQNPED
jgi:hypothetical protein